jgi:hypothetical protein
MSTFEFQSVASTTFGAVAELDIRVRGTYWPGDRGRPVRAS